MFMFDAIRCPEDTLSTDICPMSINYALCIYNRIPDMQYGFSTTEIWPRSMFEPVPETLINYHVWGCPTYVLELKLQSYGLNISKWDPRSQIGFNMDFNKMHSTQIVLVLNFLNGSISPHYHVAFDDILFIVVSSTAVDPEVCIILVTSRN